jgi:acetyltransferase-like isoleucine patch superfamily enzyme
MHTYVVDSELRPVALGVPGELLLSGPRLALNYAGQPELTADKFIPNPCLDLVSAHIDPSLASYYRKAYRTGDMVRWCSDGTLEYLGRIDRQVKVMGVRIELGEVENAISDAPGVTAAAVTAITLAGGKTLVGFVTPDTVDIEAALAHCRSMVLPSAVPSKIIALKSFPLLPSGKADVKALEQIALDANLNANSEGNGDWYVPPSTDLEVAIVRVWHEVLLLPEEEISVEADFFTVGGNSLKAGILTSHLRSTLNMPRLQATTVYTGKSVRGMAALIEKTNEEEFLNREKMSKGSNSILKRLTNKASSKPSSIILHPHADDVKLELLSSENPTRLPYWAYLILQWIMLALLSTVQPILWGALLAMLFSTKRIVGWGGVVGLWPVMRILSLVINAILLFVLKWILVGRLKPGVYPLHGWMYARWVTLRALQSQMSVMLLPILKRTTLLPWLLRGLGAKIESPSTTLIESLDISDFDLITLGKGSCIYHAAVVTGAFVAPAGYLRRHPVLVLSPVVIGNDCHIGCNAVVSAGTTIPDSHNLKPHASPAHPGDAPVAGPLSDHPHFTPEERLPTIVNLAAGLLVFIWETLAQEPAIALALYLIAAIVGRVPLLEGLFATYQAWQLVAFGALFAIFYRLVSPITCMAAQALAVFVWKWCFVGRLTPGRNLAKSKLSLFNYSVLRRLVEHPRWLQVQEVFAGTPAMAAIYRGLGAKIGRQVFLGLNIIDFDAVTIHDYACSGSSSRILAADGDGMIEQVIIRREATIGNTSTLYPGCDIGERAVIGNDTPICKDRTVPSDTRVMGSIQYSVGRRRDTTSGSVAEDGKVDDEIELGLPTIVKNSASGVDAYHLPLWHSALVIIVLILVEPIAPIVGWLPVAAVITVLQSGFIYLVIVAYPILITIGWVLVVIVLRLMLEISGIRRLWAAGSASCFNLRALVIHSWFSLTPSGLNALNGTPFMVWIFRALGFSVGSGAVILGVMPLESALVSVGEDSVLEAQSMLDGHYLEFARFIYNPLKVGKACWVQEGARVMPATELKDGSRVLPSSLVLPGDTLDKDMIWGGLPAEPLGPRPHSKPNNPRRKLLRSGRIGDSANSNLGRKFSGKKGKIGFLGSFASSN